MVLLVALFLVSALFWVRLPERALGAFCALSVLLCAVLLAVLGDLSRAQAALVAGGVLLGTGFVGSGLTLTRLPRPGKRPRPIKTQRAVPVLTGPTTTEIRLSDYEVLERIGIGGMGNVYRARRLSDARTVALKVPQEKYLADAKFVKRFYREAEVLRRLAHPNIVRVFDYKAEEGEHYIAMEYLDGETLEQVLETRSLTFAESVQVVRALAGALGHIHAQNIVHRDLKPSNVMVLRGAFRAGELREGGIKLMDFGIAVGKVLTRLTMTGARVGTPIYMAPEQAKGNKVDARSDVYSLGLLFYEMVTGETAFKGSYEAVVHQQVFEMPRPPKQVRMDVPGKLSELILRMIDKDPAARPSVEDILTAIDANLLQEDDFTDPWALALSVQEKQGTLRLLDVMGRLRQNLADLGSEGGLPAAPLALTSDARGHLYASVLAYRAGAQVPSMIYQLDQGGRRVAHFGRYGMGEGELLQPISMCSTAEKLYVLDAETCFVSVYSHSGQYHGRFGGRGSGRGRFEKPLTIAASRNGDIFVLDVGSREVQRLSGDGRYLSRLAFKLDRTSDVLRPLDGLALDSQGAVYIADAQASKIRRIEQDGKTGAVFPIDASQGEATEAPWLIGIDDQGTLFCIRQGAQTLRRFSPEGKLLATIDTYSPVLAMTLLERGKVLA
ncbi:serine/threonine-protein kinase [Deinococcus peraridilitoris]|nr:serine/threonine-protein kinase [Deinococcus peraridilitoris]